MPRDPALHPDNEPERKRRPVGRPRSRDVERKILDVTVQLLNDQGYRGFTLGDIVSAARVSKSSIYRRWASKEMLVMAAFDTFVGLEDPTGETLADRLFDLMKQDIGLLQASQVPNVLPALIGERSVNAELAVEFDKVIFRRREPFRKAIRWGISTGQIGADCDVELLLDSLVGPIFLRQFVYGDGRIADATIRAIVAANLRARGGDCDWLSTWEGANM